MVLTYNRGCIIIAVKSVSNETESGDAMDITELSSKDKDIVSGCFLFRGAAADTVLKTLSDQRCKTADYKKNETIFDAEDFFRSIGIILKGEISVSSNPSEERKYIMNRLSAGAIFGAAAMFVQDEDYLTCLTAASDCRILFIPQPLLEDVMRSDHEVAMNYIRFLSGRICFLNKKIKGLVSVSANQNLARYLIANANSSGSGTFVHMNVSMSALASMLNMGRASLYRAVDALENAGLIKRNGKDIDILDLKGLSNI